MQNGWIKLHRKLLANSIFSSEKGLKIWIWCLLKANHKSNDIFVGRQKVSLLQGQFAFGRKKASQELEMSASTVWFWMLTLESNTYIDIKRTSKYSIVTINKWKEYQLIDSQVVQKKCDKSATKDTNKNVKNVKKTTKGEKISKKLVNTLLQERRLQRPDGDYVRDNIYPARTLGKMLGVLIKERTGKEATDNDKIDRFKYIINHLSDFDLPNATKISYFTRNWNRIINKLKE